MAKLTVKPAEPPKQNQRQPANNTNKRAKKWAAINFYRIFGCIWVTSKFDNFNYVAYDCTWILANRFSPKLPLPDSFIP